MEYEILEIETEFMENEAIPKKYSGYGENISPGFKILNLSENAKSFVITLEDLTHPIKNFTHWVAWNIEANSIIEENIGKKENVVQGVAYGRHKYRGPKPPFSKPHNYKFTIYAIDTFLDIPSKYKKKKVLKEIEDHILQKGSIIGYYSKKENKKA